MKKSCGCKAGQTEKDGCNNNNNECKSTCKSRIESYGFANAVTKVGKERVRKWQVALQTCLLSPDRLHCKMVFWFYWKPFIPTFELFSISTDENGCPVESSSKTINQDYTIIITGKFGLLVAGFLLAEIEANSGIIGNFRHEILIRNIPIYHGIKNHKL